MFYIRWLLTFPLIIVYFFYRSSGEDRPLESHDNHGAMKTQYVETRIALADAPSPGNCPLTVTVHNIGTETLKMIDFKTGTYRCEVSIRSPDGKPCPYTTLGKRGFAGPRDEIGSTWIEVIDPGAEFTFTIPLEKLFQLAPGEFILTCKVKVMSDSASRDVELPEIKFIVQAAK